jgi:hypothetical protein
MIAQLGLSARISWKYRTVPVENINRRSTSNGVVVYNRFGGMTIPSSRRPGESELQHAVRMQMAMGDAAAGGEDIDTSALLRDLRISTRDRGLESGTMKIVCVPAGSKGSRPGISPDAPIQLLIEKMTADTVTVPPHGYVISLGSARDMFTYASVGDTIRLHLQASTVGEAAGLLPRGGITEVITGSPRLMRDGQIEDVGGGDGIHPDRYFTEGLARTAVGTTLAGDTVMLVTVDPPDPATGRPGVSLARLAELMYSFGAWDALNLENGAASAMVIEGAPVGTITAREMASSAFVIMSKK